MHENQTLDLLSFRSDATGASIVSRVENLIITTLTIGDLHWGVGSSPAYKTKPV